MQEDRSSNESSAPGPRVVRREFLGRAAGTALLAGSIAPVPQKLFAFQKPAAGVAAAPVNGKDPRLVVHSAQPLEVETPLTLLRDHDLTPKEILFVRNNQEMDGSRTLESPADGDWKVELDGLIEFPRELSLAELKRQPRVEVEMVLQCSGNGRAMFSEAAPAKGSPWAHGAVGNVQFAGASLKQVLAALKAELAPQSRYVTAEGRDRPAKPQEADFEHSLPLDDALSRSLLAWEMNGEPIPAAHGGPLRLVTPGYYGTMHVKWLSRLRFESQETYNHHQLRRYRTPTTPLKPGSAFTSDLQNSEPNWRMRIKSVIFAPLDGERLPVGETVVRGVAWNDGAAALAAVEISLDGGQSWRQAKLKDSRGPYAWRGWELTVTLAAGEAQIQARAVDALGRAQPLDGQIFWNPAGYTWNGVQTVRAEVT